MADDTTTTPGEIQVLSPIKQGDGMKAYISYKVTRDGVSVIRRYSDFVWLQERLQILYPGYVIPPLPEKKQLGRFDPEFIEVRRKYLQRFLKRISVHDALKASQDFADFMSATEQELIAVKHRSSASSGKGFMQWFGETVMAVSQTLGQVEVPKTPGDAFFDDHCAYVDSLAPQLETAYKHAKGLVSNQKAHASCLFEFGLAFTLLGQSETQPGTLGKALSQLGHTADTLSQITSDQAKKEASFFAEPLKDYIGITTAVRDMLDKRKERQLTYQTAVADVMRAERAELEVKQKVGSNPNKIKQAEETIAQAKKKQKAAKAELDMVDERVQKEIQRFKAEKLVDLRQIVLEYVRNQIEYQKKVEATWKRLLPEFDTVGKEAEKIEKEDKANADASANDLPK
eukprot:g4895.t1